MLDVPPGRILRGSRGGDILVLWERSTTYRALFEVGEYGVRDDDGCHAVATLVQLSSEEPGKNALTREPSLSEVPDAYIEIIERRGFRVEEADDWSPDDGLEGLRVGERGQR